MARCSNSCSTFRYDKVEQLEWWHVPKCDGVEYKAREMRGSKAREMQERCAGVWQYKAREMRGSKAQAPGMPSTKRESHQTRGCATRKEGLGFGVLGLGIKQEEALPGKRHR